MTVSSRQSRTPLDFFKKTHSVSAMVLDVVRFQMQIYPEYFYITKGGISFLQN